MVKSVQETLKNLESAEVPPLETIFESKSHQYPYNETYESAKWNPIVVLHSSGSTGTLFSNHNTMKTAKAYAGTPKPITMTHGTFATIDNDRNMPVIGGRRNADSTIWDFKGDGLFFSPFPPSHVSFMIR